MHGIYKYGIENSDWMEAACSWSDWFSPESESESLFLFCRLTQLIGVKVVESCHKTWDGRWHDMKDNYLGILYLDGQTSDYDNNL